MEERMPEKFRRFTSRSPYSRECMQEDAQQHILQHEILEKVPCFKSLVQDRKKGHEASTLYIVRQGEEGDTFFITGKVRCTVNDSGVMGGERTVAVLGANEFVGEIALLEDVPRTANCLQIRRR